MLTRILTAAVLLPLALWAVFYLPADGFALLIGACLALGAWEWGGFMRVKLPARLFFVLINVVGYYLLWLIRDDSLLRLLVLEVAVLWWLAATAWIVLYPRGLPEEQAKTATKTIVGFLTLQPAFLAVSYLQSMDSDGPFRLLGLLVIIWAADTGAYFAGRALGKNKLAPKVSPGKTWEGVAGGLVCSAIMAALGAVYVFQLSGLAMAGFVLLGLAVAAISVVGDLSESMFKRHAGVKDSGQIFPGHGGMLDRLDSLTAAAPCYLLGLLLLHI
ncbi:MAG: phosphatidate cytidylyltransferase [Nevskiales bacterium]